MALKSWPRKRKKMVITRKSGFYESTDVESTKMHAVVHMQLWQQSNGGPRKCFMEGNCLEMLLKKKSSGGMCSVEHRAGGGVRMGHSDRQKKKRAVCLLTGWFCLRIMAPKTSQNIRYMSFCCVLCSLQTVYACIRWQLGWVMHDGWQYQYHSEPPAPHPYSYNIIILCLDWTVILLLILQIAL